MSTDKIGYFDYISYVTLRQAWGILKTNFLIWLFISIFIVLIHLFFDFGVSKTESFWADIPKPFLLILGFAIITWMIRGEEYKIVFPQNFKIWLIGLAVFSVLILAAEYLPSWVYSPLWLGIIINFSALDLLSAVGRENFQKLEDKLESDA